jgi:septum formation protein
MPTPTIVELPAVLLASASPRRGELLRQINVEFEQFAVEVPEQRDPIEMPHEYVRRLALAKAKAGRALYQTDDRPVIGADTVVVYDDMVFGKPRDQLHAMGILRRLSGGTHQVVSAVAVVTANQALVSESTSEVTFRDLSDAEISAYWQTGEPQDKAGGYAIQGQAALFVSKIKGSYSGIMGLPLFETAQLLRQLITETQ